LPVIVMANQQEVVQASSHPSKYPWSSHGDPNSWQSVLWLGCRIHGKVMQVVFVKVTLHSETNRAIISSPFAIWGLAHLSPSACFHWWDLAGASDLGRANIHCGRLSLFCRSFTIWVM
jgi:hypothetical protein